eukprot:3540250-Ditylum_brightwellii.AAC.1
MPRRKQPKEEEEVLWRKSNAKLRILDDLKDGTFPLYKRELSAKDAWRSAYKSKPEFSSLTFNIFEARLKDH